MGSFLGACKIHKNNIEFAEFAFRRIVEVEPENVGHYILSSNIYLDAGKIEDVKKIREMMRGLKLGKDSLGYGCIEYEERIHMFLAGDKYHPEVNEIYQLGLRLPVTSPGAATSRCQPATARGSSQQPASSDQKWQQPASSWYGEVVFQRVDDEEGGYA